MGPDIRHKHLIIRAEISEPINKESFCDLWLSSLVKKLDMKILMGPYSKYCPMEGNEGITGVVVIETSHIALHIWDHISPAILQLDVYSCKDFELDTVFNHLSVMSPSKIEWKYLDREKELTLLDQNCFK